MAANFQKAPKKLPGFLTTTHGMRTLLHVRILLARADRPAEPIVKRRNRLYPLKEEKHECIGEEVIVVIFGK